MKTLTKYLLSILLVGYSFAGVFGSDNDSLWLIHNNELALSFVDNNPGASIALAKLQIDVARKYGSKKYEGLAYNIIGSAYKNKCDFPKALEFHLRSLSIFESLGLQNEIGLCYIGLGNVYWCQSEFSKALKYMELGLVIFEKLGDKIHIAACYNGIALAYGIISDYKLSMKFYLKSLAISKEIGDKKSIARSYSNIGFTCLNMGNYPCAFENQFNALHIYKEIDAKVGIAASYINLAFLYFDMHKFNTSISYSDSGLVVAKQIGELNYQRVTVGNLSSVYEKIGNYKQAYVYQVQFKLLTDSIFNIERDKKLGDLKVKFEVDKKDLEIKNQKSVAMAKSFRQQMVIYVVAFVLVLVFCFSIIIFRSYRLSQKQKGVIEAKQKEVLDSIHYAKRIQDALLKEQNHVSTHLPEHFVLFKPKDIVSGDFYWSFENNDYWYVAVADCTGHGVPGAFLTMLGTSFLNEIVSVDTLLTPAEILNQLRDKFIKELGQTGASGENKDGMDISLVRIDLHTKKIAWAGANNSLYIISGGQLGEIKANKQPIGFSYDLKPFEDSFVQLSKGDGVYLFSDGYADQFGGPNGKKFMSKKFKEQLMCHSDLNMQEQKVELDCSFEYWKGSLGQIDDVCVIGIKL